MTCATNARVDGFLKTISDGLALAAPDEIDRCRLLLAVSAGVDSMALLDAMATLFPADRLVVAHYHHATRAEASDGDLACARDAAHSRGIAFVSEKREPSLPASENGLREARLGFLRRAARENGCSFCVTAHHLDDRIETLFMRLIRGTGADGLGSIPARRGIFLRPMLSLSRDQVIGFARERGLHWREDLSNSDLSFFRNRVRAEIMPVFRSLCEGFGGAESASRRTGALMSEIDELTKGARGLARRWLARHAVRTERWTRVPAEPFCRLAPWLQARVLREVLRALGAPAPDRDATQRLSESLHSPRTRSQVVGGIDVLRSCGQVFFRPPSQEAPRPKWAREGELSTCEQLGIELALRHELVSNFELRFARPGDRLGSRKLKRVFLERRVPQPERALIPVLARAGRPDLVWCFPDPHEAVRIQRAAFPYSFTVPPSP